MQPNQLHHFLLELCHVYPEDQYAQWMHYMSCLSLRSICSMYALLENCLVIWGKKTFSNQQNLCSVFWRQYVNCCFEFYSMLSQRERRQFLKTLNFNFMQIIFGQSRGLLQTVPTALWLGSWLMPLKCITSKNMRASLGVFHDSIVVVVFA